MYDTIVNTNSRHIKCRDRVLGPTSYATIVGAPVGASTVGKEYKYLEGKPYQAYDIPNQESKVVWCKTSSGKAVQIEQPSFESVVQEIMFSDLVDELNPYLDSDEWESFQDGLSNALETGNLLLGVTALESEKTLDMVAFVFFRLFKILRDLLKSAKKLNLVATYDILADLWLEYRYGWRPLLGELEAAARLLYAEDLSGIQSSYGGRLTEIGQPFSTVVSVTNRQGYQLHYEVSWSVTDVSSKVGFNYLNTASSRNDDIWAKLGLDLESLLSTAWDLIPFSFIIDMFANIAGILQVFNVEDQITCFNQYVSRVINYENIRYKCVGINGTASHEVSVDLFPRTYYEERFADWHRCRGIKTIDYWTAFFDRCRNTNDTYAPLSDQFGDLSDILDPIGVQNGYPTIAFVNRADGATDEVRELFKSPDFKFSDLLQYDPSGRFWSNTDTSHDTGYKGHEYGSKCGSYTPCMDYSHTWYIDHHIFDARVIWYHKYKHKFPQTQLMQRLMDFLFMYGPDVPRSVVAADLDKYFHIVRPEELEVYRLAAQASIDSYNSGTIDQEQLLAEAGDNLAYFSIATYHGTDRGDGRPLKGLRRRSDCHFVAIGFQPSCFNDIIFDEEMDFKPSPPGKYFRREMREVYEQPFTWNTDLSTAQWADIAIIGEKLLSTRIKGFKHK